MVQRNPLLSTKDAERRPRASILQVRALYAAISSFCRELVPLNTERRSRRFWAHWREVSGDRGVRRSVVEAILSSATTADELAAAFIAEVQSVDLESVRELIDRIGAEGPIESAPPPRGEERSRGALLGASVKVEGLAPED